MRKLLERVLGAGPGERVRFWAVGGAVMFGTERSESCWCYVEPHHSTEQARGIAHLKASQTAKLLQAAADAEQDHAT